MSISKKIRFEVFKRDGFTCAYCGKQPPNVTLEADHIIRSSKGGKNDINNLITACFDCNRGKTNIPLTKAPNRLSDNLEILKEKENQIREYNKWVKKIEKRLKLEADEVDEIYSASFPKWRLSDKFIDISLRRFQQALPIDEIKDSMRIACSKGYDDNRTIRYFCGICWRKIRGENG